MKACEVMTVLFFFATIVCMLIAGNTDGVVHSVMNTCGFFFAVGLLVSTFTYIGLDIRRRIA